jgi:hypothetical protein
MHIEIIPFFQNEKNGYIYIFLRAYTVEYQKTKRNEQLQKSEERVLNGESFTKASTLSKWGVPFCSCRGAHYVKLRAQRRTSLPLRGLEL